MDSRTYSEDEIDNDYDKIDELLGALEDAHNDIIDILDDEERQLTTDEINDYIDLTVKNTLAARVIIGKYDNYHDEEVAADFQASKSRLNEDVHDLSEFLLPETQTPNTSLNEDYLAILNSQVKLVDMHIKLGDAQVQLTPQEKYDARKEIIEAGITALRIFRKYKNYQAQDQEESEKLERIGELENDFARVLNELKNLTQESPAPAATKRAEVKPEPETEPEQEPEKELETEYDEDSESGLEAEVEAKAPTKADEQTLGDVDDTQELYFEVDDTENLESVLEDIDDDLLAELLAEQPAVLKKPDAVAAPQRAQPPKKEKAEAIPQPVIRKVTIDDKDNNIVALNELPQDAEARNQKIIAQMFFACEYIEKKMGDRKPEDQIQIEKCPRNLQRAIVAYCHSMGYPLDFKTVTVKFNAGEKDDMIAQFTAHLDDKPELKKIVEDKKARIAAAAEAKAREREQALEQARAATLTAVTITPKIYQILEELKALDSAISNAPYKDKDRLKTELLQIIGDLNPETLYAITVTLFADHIQSDKDHLLRTAEGLKKYAYIAFAKKVGYDLRPTNEAADNPFSMAPDKPNDPRIDVLNWFVRKSMGKDVDVESVCNNIAFCIIGGVRYDAYVNPMDAIAIEKEKNAFLSKGVVRDAYISHVVNDKVKSNAQPIIVKKAPEVIALERAAKPKPVLERAPSMHTMQPVVEEMPVSPKAKKKKDDSKPSFFKPGSKGGKVKPEKQVSSPRLFGKKAVMPEKSKSSPTKNTSKKNTPAKSKSNK